MSKLSARHNINCSILLAAQYQFNIPAVWLELQSKIHEDFTITDKAATTFPGWKGLLTPSHLRHYVDMKLGHWCKDNRWQLVIVKSSRTFVSSSSCGATPWQYNILRLILYQYNISQVRSGDFQHHIISLALLRLYHHYQRFLQLQLYDFLTQAHLEEMRSAPAGPWKWPQQGGRDAASKQ